MMSDPRTGPGRAGFQGSGPPAGGGFRSFASVLQRTAQLVPGAVDVRLDGPEWQVEGGGDLLVGASLDVTEHDAGSVLRAQAGDGPFDGGPQLLRLDLLERVLGDVG